MFYHFDTTRAAGQSETESFLMHPAAARAPAGLAAAGAPAQIMDVCSLIQATTGMASTERMKLTLENAPLESNP